MILGGRAILIRAAKTITQRTQRRLAGRPPIPQSYAEENLIQGETVTPLIAADFSHKDAKLAKENRKTIIPNPL